MEMVAEEPFPLLCLSREACSAEGLAGAQWGSREEGHGILWSPRTLFEHRSGRLVINGHKPGLS